MARTIVSGSRGSPFPYLFPFRFSTGEPLVREVNTATGRIMNTATGRAMNTATGRTIQTATGRTIQEAV